MSWVLWFVSQGPIPFSAPPGGGRSRVGVRQGPWRWTLRVLTGQWQLQPNAGMASRQRSSMETPPWRLAQWEASILPPQCLL